MFLANVVMVVRVVGYAKIPFNREEGRGEGIFFRRGWVRLRFVIKNAGFISVSNEK